MSELRAMTPAPGAIAFVLGAAISAKVIALIGIRVLMVPDFSSLFREFGGPLPGFTKVVLGNAWYGFWIAALVASIATGALPVIPIRARIAVLAAGAGAGLVVAISTVAGLYLPLFALSSAVK